MARIPQRTIDRLLDRTDLVDLISERVDLRASAGEAKGLCPFHEENTPSFTVVPDKGFYYCFGCGANGNALGFLMKYDGLDFVDAVNQLKGRLGEGRTHMRLAISESSPKTELIVPKAYKTQTFPNRPSFTELREDDRELCLRTLSTMQGFYQDALENNPRARDYLESRGLKPRDFGYAPKDQRFVESLIHQLENTQEDGSLGPAWLYLTGFLNDQKRTLLTERITMPIRSRNGQVLGYNGRTITGAKSKYMNFQETPFFDKRQMLVGLEALTEPINELAIVEGPLDLVGFQEQQKQKDMFTDSIHALATGGTALTEHHLMLFENLRPNIVYICNDGDPAGRVAALKSANRIAGYGSLHDWRPHIQLVDLGDEDPFDVFYTDGLPLAQIRDMGLDAEKWVMRFADNIDAFFLRGSEEFYQTLGYLFDKNPRNPGSPIYQPEFTGNCSELHPALDLHPRTPF